MQIWKRGLVIGGVGWSDLICNIFYSIDKLNAYVHKFIHQ